MRSPDGAHVGYTANEGLAAAVLGGPRPAGADRLAVESRIRLAPLPGEGARLWERAEVENACALVADSLAHAFLVLADERPALLTTQLRYPDDHEYEVLRGRPRDLCDAMWEAFVERWPEGDAWLGGVTGFMVGWAFNCVRYIKGLPPARNPAVLG